MDQVGPWYYPTHALDTLPDIADLPIGGLDWSDIAQEAGSYPCHPAPKAGKPLLLMDLPYVGREGSKFWKFKKESLMEIIVYQSGGKVSLRKHTDWCHFPCRRTIDITKLCCPGNCYTRLKDGFSIGNFSDGNYRRVFLWRSNLQRRWTTPRCSILDDTRH